MFTRRRQFPHGSRDCLHPPVVFHRLAYLPNETRVYIAKVAGVEGAKLPAAYKHIETGQIRYKTEIIVAADTTIHLFRSKFEEWYHTVEFDTYRQVYLCSCSPDLCKTGKQCAHVREVISAKS